MASHLPFRATTASGDRYDISFPLHPETRSPARVAQLLSALLETLSRETQASGETSNGDLLQALAMAIAVRARMIGAPPRVTDRLATDLVDTALAAMDDATTHRAISGRA